MQTLAAFTPAMEIYSIDEAFLDLDRFAFTDLTTYGKQIRQTVRQHTGIPVSIGMATSKTLCKREGTCCISDESRPLGIVQQGMVPNHLQLNP